MPQHHFISYSTAEAPDFAQRLHDALEAEHVPAWLDKRDLKAGIDWDIQIRDAIRDSFTLLFVMTPDSVADTSVCRDEWSLALKYKTPVIPLRLDSRADAPFRLQNRQYIDFTDGFDAGIARLREHLRWMNSPAGRLQALQDRWKDAERALRRARDDHERTRITQEMEQLREDIAAQQALVDDPEGVAKRAEASIEARIAVERQPERAPRAATRFINPPPMTAPAYFQDRFDQTKQIADFLKDDSLRLLTLVGTGGVGKTATVCRVLKALHSGKLPDDLGPLPVDGIVYLSTGTGPYRVSAPTLFAGLRELLLPDAAAAFDAIYRNAQLSTADKMGALLGYFPAGRVIVLLDNFEDVTALDTRTLRDTELDEALRALLSAPQHGVKALITTRVKPRDLALVHPECQRVYDLDEGLESPYAENILREMDDDGALGLRDAPDAVLGEARELTRGFPRALEALVAILRSDRETGLDGLLADLRRWHAQESGDTLDTGVSHVVETLVGEAFNRLDTPARQVMQALAIYNRPVPAVAVDHLLQPFAPGLDSARVLKRLVNMHFARHDAGRYYLHPVDAAYALSLIPEEDKTPAPEPEANDTSDEEKSPLDILAEANAAKAREKNPPFTRLALYARGADYFRSARTPRDEWTSLADLEAQLAEIDLRCAAQDYDTAARVLLDIDFDYLLLWGHFRLMMDLHQRLQGQIGDSTLQRISVGNLGQAYAAMGRVREAITCYEAALASAREIGDRRGEGAWLGSLGNAYRALGEVRRAIEYHEQALAIARAIGDRRGEGAGLGSLGNAYRELGEVRRAIDFYQQALAIAREIGDRRGEGACLGNLGNAYRDLGEVRRAIEYHEQALSISRAIGDRRGEGADLGNLGIAYRDLGEVRRAIEFYQQALAIARDIGDRRGEGADLGNLGEALRDSGDVQRAIEYFEQALTIYTQIGDRGGEAFIYRELGYTTMDQSQLGEAIQIADEIEFTQIQNEARFSLALAHLVAGDLPAARAAIEEARQYDVPANNHNVLALHGVIALRQGESSAAQEAFAAAVAAADDLLAKTAESYDALDAKGLALAGLALCGDAAQVPAAVAAFRAARAITSAPGIVAGALQVFDALDVCDASGRLAEVRAAAAGE
jgi:tetratricopeptide (TPR) repeat protein